MQVALYGFAITELQRICDQGVTDRNFAHARHGAQKISQIGATEIVTGIDFQAGLLRGSGRRRKARQLFAFLWAAMRGGIGLGVQLHPIGADGDKRFFPLNMTTLDRAGEPEPVNPPSDAGDPSRDAPDVGADNERPPADRPDDLAAGVQAGLAVVFEDALRRVLRREANSLARPPQNGDFDGWRAGAVAAHADYARSQAQAPALTFFKSGTFREPVVVKRRVEIRRER